MKNLEVYNNVFINNFEISEDDLQGLEYQSISAWEEAFDIMMDTDDIIDLSSYEKGKEILVDNYEIEF